MFMNGMRKRILPICKKPKNKAEAQCFDLLCKMGFLPTKRGYPDFMCIKNGELTFVEVKPNAETKLTPEQEIFMDTLEKHGFLCYVYRPGNLKKFKHEERSITKKP